MEFALLFPLIVARMVFILVAGLIVYDHLALADLSRSSVRAAVTSDDPATTAQDLVAAIDPNVRVRTTVDNESGLVLVRLERKRRLPLLFISNVLPQFTVRASSVMLQEPGIVIGEGLE